MASCARRRKHDDLVYLNRRCWVLPGAWCEGSCGSWVVAAYSVSLLRGTHGGGISDTLVGEQPRESEPVRLRLGGSFVCGKVCLLRLPGKQTGRKIDVIPLRYPKPE